MLAALIIKSWKVKSVILNFSLREIAEKAFRWCKQLSRLSVPNNSALERIGNFAFFTTGLKIFRTSQYLREIGVCAFADCDRLFEVNIDEGVTQIDKDAF